VLTLEGSRKAWAADLGLSHEALYRTIRRMVDAGTLSVDGQCIALAGDTASAGPSRTMNKR
jgi:hypothetical protein